MIWFVIYLFWESIIKKLCCFLHFQKEENYNNSLPIRRAELWVSGGWCGLTAQTEGNSSSIPIPNCKGSAWSQVCTICLYTSRTGGWNHYEILLVNFIMSLKTETQQETASTVCKAQCVCVDRLGQVRKTTEDVGISWCTTLQPNLHYNATLCTYKPIFI